MISESVEYRDLISFEDFKDVEDIQRDAWGMPPLEIVPRRLMYATVCSGGVAIGAFVENKLIGYCWGWVGKKTKKVFIYSHHNAVRKEFQNKGIGYTLKLKQRDWAIKHDFNTITWTFDPLLPRNSYLNLHKLGAICRTYYINHWGEMHDALNIGQQTDRFYVEWELKTKHVQDRVNKIFPSYGDVFNKENQITVTATEAGKLLLKEAKLDLQNEILFVEIPPNFLEASKEDFDWGNVWRLKTREIFVNYFKKGYSVTDFIVNKKAKTVKCYHVLMKNSAVFNTSF